MRFRLATCAALILATGCGADPSPQPSPTSTFNATDVMFLQMMVPHHRQGIELVRLAKDRASRSELKTLAAAIEVTQESEVQEMSAWLATWGQPSTVDASAHDAHGGPPGTGPEEIAALAQTPLAEFERTFLNTLIAHQDDAIQIARMEIAGINPEAKSLGHRIEASRKAQIQQMLAMLGQ